MRSSSRHRRVTTPSTFAVDRLERRALLAAVVLNETVTDFGGSEFADDVETQRDGRFVVLGHTESPAGGRLFLARYDIDGTLDPFFGEDGRIFGESTRFTRATSMAIDRGGRITVAGVTNDADPAIAVMRFTRSGFLDTSFGNGGLATINAGAGEVVNDVAVDSSGRVTVAGQVQATSGATTRPVFMVARFEPSGQADDLFGGPDAAGDGVVAFAVGVGDSGATSVVLDGSRILVGGFATEQTAGEPAERRFAVARLERTGAPDDDWGDEDGVVTFDVGLPSTVQDLARARDGKLVVAGNTLPTVDNPGEQVLVARLDRGGSLDPGFGGGDGFTLSSFGAARAQLAREVVVDRSSRLLLAAEIADGGAPAGDLDDDRFVLARYLADGTPDETFASGGAVINEAETGADSFEQVGGLTLQRDGHNGTVVVAGNAGPTAADQDVAVVRFATDATPATGSATLRGSKLVVKGSDRQDVITVSADAGAGTVDVTVNGATQSFPAASVRRLEVGARDGDDEVTCSAPREIVTVLLGGEGDDDLRLLGDAEGRLEGDDGDDLLVGGIHSDRLRGQDGEDSLFGDDGDDDLDGGDGFDELFGEDGDDDLKSDDGFPDDVDGGSGDDKARIDFFDFVTRVDDVDVR